MLKDIERKTCYTETLLDCLGSPVEKTGKRTKRQVEKNEGKQQADAVKGINRYSSIACTVARPKRLITDIEGHLTRSLTGLVGCLGQGAP